MTLTREQIEAEFDAFIEYPTDDKRYVSTVSTKLFAEHIARIAFNAGRARGLGEAKAICITEGNEWDSDDVAIDKNYAHHCAAAIEQLRSPRAT